jgi:HD-GYP domain-containing protein (c-di-GMP phosphodiesterase class II)
MTSDRAYRRAVVAQDAIDELRLCSGSQFDAQVVAALEQFVVSGRVSQDRWTPTLHAA